MFRASRQQQPQQRSVASKRPTPIWYGMEMGRQPPGKVQRTTVPEVHAEQPVPELPVDMRDDADGSLGDGEPTPMEQDGTPIESIGKVSPEVYYKIQQIGSLTDPVQKQRLIEEVINMLNG